MQLFLNSLKTMALTASAVLLVAMMLLTALDVGMRYLLNNPLSGALELVEFMMAILIPFSLVVTAYDKAHIEVDLIVEQLPVRLQQVTGCATEAISLIFYVLITWQSYLYGSEQYYSGLTSAVLLIPHHPFVASLTVAFGMLSFISLIYLFQRCHVLIIKWIP